MTTMPAPMNLPKFNVEWVKTETLKAYAKNARKHSPSQIGQIEKSIRAYGWTVPLVVGRGNTILAGHGRLIAARNLGIDTVPVVRAEHLTEQQMRAYVIADNKLTENGEWDWELLRDELKALESIEFDLDLTGFSEQEFNVINGGNPSHESYLDLFLEDALDTSADNTEARAAREAAGDDAQAEDNAEDDVEIVCPHCGGTISVKSA